MTKIVDRRPTRPEDELRATLRDIKRGYTRPHGVKVADVGDALMFPGPDGELRVLDATFVDDTNQRIEEGAELLDEARIRLEAVKDGLELTEDRIAQTDTALAAAEVARLDAAARLGTVETNLAQTATDLATAEDRIAAAGTENAGRFSQLDSGLATARANITSLGTDLTALGTRTTAARTIADKATADLKLTDTALTTARSDITSLGGQLATAQTAISSLGTDLASASATATAARTTADKAATDLAATQRSLTTTRTELTGLDTRVGNVATAAATADQKGADALAAAAAAAADAQAAYDYAKGLDPSAGGSDSYAAAMEAAQAASRDALAAMTRANAAYDSAAGKTSVRNATTTPQGVGLAPGDLWRRWTAFPSGVVIGEWTWDGAAWRPQTISHQMISSLDLGTATVGRLHGSYISAGSLTTEQLLVGVGGNLFPDPTLTNPDALPNWTQTRIGAPGTGYAGAGSILIEAGEGQRGTYFGATESTKGLRTPVTPGSFYNLAARVRLAAATTTTGVRLYARVYNSATGEAAFATPGSISLPAGSAANTWHSLAGTVQIPDGYDRLALGFFLNGDFTEAGRFSKPSIEPAADGHLIVDGSVTARTVDALSVAGAVGRFVEVEAANVKVTGDLAARVVAAMDVATRNIVVTGSATLAGDTWAKNLAAEAITAARIGVGQLTAGTANLDTATALKLFADIFAVRKVTAAEITVSSTLSAEVARLMSVASRNLVVTGSTTLSGRTYIEDLAAGVVTAARIGVGQLTAGTANLDTATALKLFAEIFAAKKISANELYIGSPSNLIPGGWGGQTTPTGWGAFGLNTTATHNAGQPAEASYWVEGRKNGVADVSWAVEPGRKYRFSVRARANVTGSRFYVQLFTNGSNGNPYVVSNQIVPNGSWGEFTGEWTPPLGVTTVTAINVYANHQNGTVTTGTQWFGAFTLSAEVPGVLIQDGTIDTPKLNVTESMAAALIRAGRTETKDLFVTGEAVIKQLTVELPAIFGDISATGKISGKSAIITESIEAPQINVTKALWTKLMQAIDTETENLLVTGNATINRATFVEGILTPKIDAVITRTDDLLANKASIADLTAGNVALSGSLRSGSLNGPSVVIPRPYGTAAGLDQVGVWLTHDGKAPSMGADYGAAAGMWIDQGSLSNPSAPNVMLIRGRNGGGVVTQGDLTALGVLRTNTLAPRNGLTNMLFDIGGRARFAGTIDVNTIDAPDGLEIRGKGLTLVNLAGAGISSWRNIFGPIEVESSSTLTTRGDAGWVAQTNGHFALRTSSGNAYNRGTPSSGSWFSLFQDGDNGRLYRSTSAKRYKADIQPFTPDPRFLDMPVVQYRDWKDPEHGRIQIGSLADDAVEYGAEALVMYSTNEDTGERQVEDYRYERETAILRWFLRQQRDQIAALTTRIEALETRP